jgi:Tfp pilus assembly protein PilN
MKSQLLESLNIAPSAKRIPPYIWLIVVIGICAAAAGLFFVLGQYRTFLDLQTVRAVKKSELRRIEVLLRQAQIENNSLDAMERVRQQSHIAALRQISWNALFDVIELAASRVDGGVSLISMLPTHVDDKSIQIDLIALASSPSIMLAYVNALKEDGHLLAVRISSSQPDERISPTALRFELSASVPARSR